MRDDYTTNSHDLTYTFFLPEVGRMQFLSYQPEEVSRCTEVKQLIRKVRDFESDVEPVFHNEAQVGLYVSRTRRVPKLLSELPQYLWRHRRQTQCLSEVDRIKGLVRFCPVDGLGGGVSHSHSQICTSRDDPYKNYSETYKSSCANSPSPSSSPSTSPPPSPS